MAGSREKFGFGAASGALGFSVARVSAVGTALGGDAGVEGFGVDPPQPERITARAETNPGATARLRIIGLPAFPVPSVATSRAAIGRYKLNPKLLGYRTQGIIGRSAFFLSVYLKIDFRTFRLIGSDSTI